MSKYDEFANDINLYLTVKLHDLDAATKMEVSEYISNRINRLIVSLIEDNNRAWDRSLRSQQRNHNKEMDRLRRLYRDKNDG